MDERCGGQGEVRLGLLVVPSMCALPLYIWVSKGWGSHEGGPTTPETP